MEEWTLFFGPVKFGFVTIKNFYKRYIKCFLITLDIRLLFVY